MGQTFSGLNDLNAKLRIWLETEANTRVHATTDEVPFARLAKENLLVVPERFSKPTVDMAQPNPRRPLFHFSPLSVEKRSLSVYEEAAT